RIWYRPVVGQLVNGWVEPLLTQRPLDQRIKIGCEDEPPSNRLHKECNELVDSPRATAPHKPIEERVDQSLVARSEVVQQAAPLTTDAPQERPVLDNPFQEL